MPQRRATGCIAKALRRQCLMPSDHLDPVPNLPAASKAFAQGRVCWILPGLSPGLIVGSLIPAGMLAGLRAIGLIQLAPLAGLIMLMVIIVCAASMPPP